MKKIGLLLLSATLALTPTPAFGQEGYRLETLTVSSGSDAITSGVSGIARFRNDNDLFAEGAYQSEQAWLAFGKYFEWGNFTLTLAGTAGHLQTAPWFGPLVDFDLELNDWLSVGFLYWPGFFTEEPNSYKTENDGVENPESILTGQFGGVRVAVGPLTFSFHLLNFLDEPWNELPGVNLIVPVSSEVELSASATWNNNQNDWMPWVGIIWSPDP